VVDGSASVLCVVRIERPNKSLVEVGDLTITKRHPIRINEAWINPVDHPSAIEIPNPSGCVYNFVLSRGHIAIVDGIECATWGHGLTAEGVKHAYYGTQQIVKDLKRMPGFKQGFVSVSGVIKNKQGRINGLIQSQQDI